MSSFAASMSQSCTTTADEHLRIAFVLIDGLGDVSVPDLNDETPLQLADIPFLDAIAGAGLNGLLDPVEPGLACGSDTAHLSILGYEPRIHYRGRGAFESLGAGIAMQPGDIAFKCNFATLDPATGIVISRRADRKFEDIGPLLCQDLNGLRLPGFSQHYVAVKYATEHRCGVAVSGPGLSDAITGTDPLKDNLPLQIVRPLDTSQEAAHTAAVVSEVSREMCSILAEHPINQERVRQGKAPANVVLLRGCGSRIAVDTFEQRHGLRACMVAPTKIIAGLGMSLGITCLDVPGATGDYRTQFHAKAAAVARALVEEGYEFGFLHVKAVDDTGHDKAAALKVGYLEAVNVMVGQLIRRLWEAESAGKGCYAVCVTGDHSTPVDFGDHSHEPVPLAIAQLRNVVDVLGGPQAVESIPLAPIPHPDPATLLSAPRAANRSRTGTNDAAKSPSAGNKQVNRSGSELAGMFFGETSPSSSVVFPGASDQGVGSLLSQSTPPSNTASVQTRPGTAHAGTKPSLADHPSGNYEQPATSAPVNSGGQQAMTGHGDGVRCFDEVSAARGALGRFPGREVMGLVKDFISTGRRTAD